MELLAEELTDGCFSKISLQSKCFSLMISSILLYAAAAPFDRIHESIAKLTIIDTGLNLPILDVRCWTFDNIHKHTDAEIKWKQRIRNKQLDKFEIVGKRKRFHNRRDSIECVYFKWFTLLISTNEQNFPLEFDVMKH